MDRPRDYHMKRSESETERQIPYITYMRNTEYDTNEHMDETDSQTENILMVAKREGVWRK